MNTPTTDTQKPKKEFNPNANGSARENESSMRGTNNPAPAGESRSNANEKATSESDAKKAAPRQASKTEEKSDGANSDASEEKSPATKSAGFTGQLDLALVDASISIGDIVKKIEALAPKEGGIARASKFTAEKLGAVQNYLGDNSSKEIVTSAWQLLRRSPWPVGLAVLGAGIGIYIQQAGSKAAPTKETPAKLNETTH